MTVRNLEYLFRPRSVAVVQETGEPSRYAEVVRHNLQGAGLAGTVLDLAAVPRPRFRFGPRIRVEESDEVPDLAIICARPDNIPEIVAQLGERGTRAVIIGPALRHQMTGAELADTRRAILDAARPHLVRILGPGSGGLAIPSIGLNASVSPVPVRPGKIALITQSTAITSAILDHAQAQRFGFSTAIHLGGAVDVDLADVLDWLAEDPDTERILVQFETIPGGRKFMSAARAASRNKPVVAIRGRLPDGVSASVPFSREAVYDAALRRAGWVQIATLEDLFEAAEAMQRIRPLSGENLAIMGNGHGLGRIAAAEMERGGGHLAVLGRDTMKKLGRILQTKAPLVGNPLPLPPDIQPAAWAAALTAVLADPSADAVLTICAPSPFAAGADVAEEISRVAAAADRNVFTCWVGGESMHEARQIAAEHGVLSNDSPERVIAGFLAILDYRRNRNLLLQMPPSQPEGYATDNAGAHAVIAEALASGARVLPPRLARRLLQAYGIEAAEYLAADSVRRAIEVANILGYPVDLGLALSNPSGSVSPVAPFATGLRSPADIQSAVRRLRGDLRAAHPETRIGGYRLRRTAARSGAAPLRAGVAEDPVFGPIIYVGPSAADDGQDAAVAVGLPPLNLTLASELVKRSGLALGTPPEARDKLEEAACRGLVRLSQLLTDIDEVVGIELDPVHVEATGAVALEATVRIEKRVRRLGLRRFAIRPYPKELEHRVDWNGRHILVRPIRPEDEQSLADLLNSLSPEDSRMRFFDTMRKLPRSQLARFTQIDYDREMALVAIETDVQGRERSLGEVRAVADPDHVVAEFAIVVDSSLKGQGLGRLLMERIIEYASASGLGELRGETLAGNRRMQALARTFGFAVEPTDDPGTVALRLHLPGGHHTAGG